MLRNVEITVMNHITFFIIFSFVLSGCTTRPVLFEVPLSHPANPEGDAASFTPPRLTEAETTVPDPGSSRDSPEAIGEKDTGGHRHMHHHEGAQ